MVGLLTVDRSLALVDFDSGGNVHHAQEKEHQSDPEGLADKLKQKILGDKKA